MHSGWIFISRSIATIDIRMNIWVHALAQWNFGICGWEMTTIWAFLQFESLLTFRCQNIISKNTPNYSAFQMEITRIYLKVLTSYFIWRANSSWLLFFSLFCRLLIVWKINSRIVVNHKTQKWEKWFFFPFAVTNYRTFAHTAWALSTHHQVIY